MANDSSSTRRSKDRGGNNSRKKHTIGKEGTNPVSASAKTGSAILRRSTRGKISCETPDTQPVKKSSSDHTNKRKAIRIEKKDITPVKRKWEVLESEKMSCSPLRRSDRGKKQPSLVSSDSNSNGKVVTVSPGVDRKKLRKGKSVQQSTDESMETSKTTKVVKRSNCQKKRRLNTHTYKALFRQQLKRDTVEDLDKELKRPEKLSQDDGSCFAVGKSKPVEDGDDGVLEHGEKIEEKCVERDYEVEKEQFISKSNDADAYVLRDDGELEISQFNSKCSSRDALGDSSEELNADALNGSATGEDVILLPWYEQDLDKKLSQDEIICFGGDASNIVEDGVQKFNGEIEEECNALNMEKETILLPWYASDSNKKLKKPENLPEDDDSFGDSMSNSEKDEKARVEDCDGEIEEERDEIDSERGKDSSLSTSNDANAHVLNNHGAFEISCSNSKEELGEQPSQEDDVKALNRSTMGEKNIDNSERLQVNYALVVELQSPEVEILSDSQDDFVGTCASCCKRRRLDYDSPSMELCSCSIGPPSDLQETFISEDMVELARCNNSQNDGNLSTCAICKLDGELLCCHGKKCKESYHLSCLDIPLDDCLLGIWYCFSCVKKKIENGPHYVSAGVEAIWDAREVVNKGLQRQRQFLVKYKDLAHIHNHWVPETQLLLEAPMLVSEFDKQKQESKWRQEWTVPHRLVKKRVLWSPKHPENSHSETANCQYEWLVKWCGLDYEHSTWELGNASFFHSPHVQSLIREFENRLQQAKEASSSSPEKSKKQSIVKLPKLRAGCSSVDEHNQISSVNKLFEFWSKDQNAIVINDQERISNVILFIASLLSDVTRPFLILSSSSALSVWESEFSRLAPFINVVVYNGSEDSRKVIRTCEFYADRGRIMLQVLLSSVEAVVEDIAVLLPRWEVIIVDECQDTEISEHFNQIRMLRMSVRILLYNGQLKERAAEHLNVLSLLDSPENVATFSGLECCQLREKLSPFIAYSCRTDSSRFEEYWVPVSASNVQLEQYCHTLISNYTTLRSSSFKDIVGGALHDILVSTKKCCDHPYFVDLVELQGFLTKDLPPVEYLDVGIRASGKLQLLDIVLSEIKSQGKRVLILYQFSAGMLTGNILDDFLRQRFGLDSYERVDKGILPSKKQAALNKFSNKESGRFVFLLEKRACSPTIKLTSVDAVVIFDSDWNLMSDNAAVQKLSFDSSPKPIKIFRLYTCCTMEEKVLDLATHNTTLDTNLQNVSRAISHSLLMWGAPYLFSKLDEFHGSNTSKSAAKLCSESDISLLQDVKRELLNLLTHNSENSCKNSNTLITKVERTGSTYSKSAPLFAYSKIKSTDGKVPHLFWTELLEGKNPRWRFFPGYSQRNRKRSQPFDALPENPGGGPDSVSKKQKKITNNSADVASPRTKRGEGGSKVIPPKSPDIVPFSSNNISPASEVSKAVSDNGVKLRDVQKNLHVLLKSTISELGEMLRLPKDVKTMGETFLEYVVDNHQISSEPSTILQAFQISLVWIAAALVRYKLDKKNSLDVAKRLLGFSCTDVDVNNVHSKLRVLQKKFKEASEKFKEIESSKEFINDNPEYVLKKCRKRKIKLQKKHDGEIEEFNKIWEKRRTEIENQHRIELVVVRTIHQHNEAIKLEKLKRVDEVFARKMDEHKRERELHLQNLKEKQLKEITEEAQKAESWLKNITHSGLAEIPISSAGEVPNENKFHDDQEIVGSVSGENPTPNLAEMTEVTTEIPMVTTEIPTVPWASLDKDTVEECNNTNIPVSAENNNISICSRLDGNVNKEPPSVILSAEPIMDTRAQDVFPRNIATSCRILDVDSPGCKNTTNILEPAEIESLHSTNTETRKTVSRAASIHANECNNVSDLIEDGPLVAHVPHSQQGEQSTLQSGENLLPPRSAHIHPSQHPQQIDLGAQPQPLDPLQVELDRLQKETEEATKLHEEATLQLKSEFKKELDAVVAELRRKYEIKLKDADAKFQMKNKELNSYQNKVFMNRVLAEAFRTKNKEVKPYVSSGMHEVPSTNFLHQLLLLSQHRGTSSISGSPNLVSPVANQQTLAPPVSAPIRPSPVITNMQIRQPSVLANPRPFGNFPGSGGMRAPAPHLRPSLPAVAPNTFSASQGLPGQDPQRRPTFSTVAQVPPQVQHQSQPIYHDQVPNPSTNFVGSYLSQGGTQGGERINAGINVASSGVDTDVVYITDDVL